jgi:F0F1-type ATP synthase assembly protein I
VGFVQEFTKCRDDGLGVPVFNEDGMAAQATPDGGDGNRPDSNDSPHPPASSSAHWMGMASLGFEFVIAVLLPGALGWWLDGRFGSRPWIMLVGGLLGFIAGLRILMRAVSSGNRR